MHACLSALPYVTHTAVFVCLENNLKGLLNSWVFPCFLSFFKGIWWTTYTKIHLHTALTGNLSEWVAITKAVPLMSDSRLDLLIEKIHSGSWVQRHLDTHLQLSRLHPGVTAAPWSCVWQSSGTSQSLVLSGSSTSRAERVSILPPSALQPEVDCPAYLLSCLSLYAMTCWNTGAYWLHRTGDSLCPLLAPPLTP